MTLFVVCGPLVFAISGSETSGANDTAFASSNTSTELRLIRGSIPWWAGLGLILLGWPAGSSA